MVPQGGGVPNTSPPTSSASPPGFEQNDWHCHNYDEWWIVLEGEIDWIIEGREEDPVHAREGDFIYVPAMTFHHILPEGGGDDDPPGSRPAGHRGASPRAPRAQGQSHC